jgi:hypothetical protein
VEEHKIHTPLYPKQMKPVAQWSYIF